MLQFQQACRVRGGEYMTLKTKFQVINIDNGMVVFEGSMEECLNRKAELEKKYYNRKFILKETVNSVVE